MKFEKNKAMILSDCGNIKCIVYYKQIHKTRDIISDFIKKHVSEKFQCIGLRMDHNIFIPSLILSLQELNHAFMFLHNDQTDEENIRQELGISWILSFDKKKNVVDSITLDNHSLYLEKQSCDKIKSYKDIFYIIRTSGTTGNNKFVRVGRPCIHSNIISLSRIFDVKSADVIYFGTPLTFDPSMVELLLALYNGACLLITPQKTRNNFLHLYETLFHADNGITILQIVPSLFLRWSEHQIAEILLNPKLRILAFGGESFPKSVLNFDRSDKLRVFNLYGITEVSCWASIYEINNKTEDIPLGEPLDDTTIEIRNESNNRIITGEGEIYIGSKTRVCLIDNESEYTDEIVFRSSGDIAIVKQNVFYYKCRKNDTFKRLGHKIHLSKIEEIIERETNLLNKIVWLEEESKLLVFFIIENFDLNIKNQILDKIRVKLLNALPKHYFPDYFDIIHKWPVTAHGKINKTVLKHLYFKGEHTNENGADVFKSLICKYFGFSKKQLEELQDQTFFEIGGNSILAIQLLNEFKEATEGESPNLITALFEKNIKSCLEAVSNIIKVNRKREQQTEIATPAKKLKNSITFKIAFSVNLGACVDATPLVFEYCGAVFAAVGSFSHTFVVVNVDNNGKEIARFHLPDVVEGSACIFPSGSFLYVGCFDGGLYCLNFMENQIRWVYFTNDRIKCKPVLSKDCEALIFGSYDKHLHCIKASDGSLLWKTSIGESIISTPIIQDNRIYTSTISGTCLCVSSTGEVCWTYKTNSPIFGSPCLLNNVVTYPNVNNGLISLSLDGKKIYQFQCNSFIYSSLIVYKNFIIFGCHDRNLYIIESDNETLKTKVTVNLNDVLTTPCICDNDKIAIAGNSGNLYLVDFDGNLLGNFQLPGEIFSSVITHKNQLFIGCRDNNLYCVEINK